MENENAKRLKGTQRLCKIFGFSRKLKVTQHYLATSMARLFPSDRAPLDVENENAKTVWRKQEPTETCLNIEVAS